MRKFTEMDFFRTLKDFQISKQNIILLETTFKEFIEGLFLESESGCNLIKYYNQLCYTRAELLFLLKGNKTNQDKKPAITKVYSKKALLLVNAQLKNPPSKKVDLLKSPYKGPKLSLCCSSTRSCSS